MTSALSVFFGRTTAMDKVLLTPEEAAQALSIGRSKVYELLRAGALASVRIGASRRIPVEAVRAYVAALAVDSAAIA
jgi:excisionase family DNA binding protein